MKNEKLGLHSHPWELLKEVDGLLNDDVVMVVASTGNKELKYFRDRVIPSSRTWLRFFKNAFVIEEDTPTIRFLMRHCVIHEYTNFTTFSCPHEPTYILTRVCSAQYYVAAGICCKVDETIHFIANANKELWAHTKYLLQSDDDTFWRVDQVLRWLAAVEKSGISDKYPLIANVDPTPNEQKQKKPGGVWHIKGCTEIKSVGWYQPLMMNRLAIDRMKVSASNYGLTQTCKNFEISQDAGIGIFAWMHSLFHIQIPGVQINSNHIGAQIFSPNEMVVHAIRHIDEDDCDGKEWPPAFKYDQTMVIGCGKIGQSSPKHNPSHGVDMYDAWLYFAEKGNDIVVEKEGINDWIKDPQSGKIIPSVWPLIGYNTTKHSEKFDITKEWHEFKMSDCAEPGKIDKRRLQQLQENDPLAWDRRLHVYHTLEDDMI